MLGLMAFVLLTGAVTRGSKRWLDLGFFKFQPSEFGKVFFVLFLAGLLADRAKRIGDSRTVLSAIGLAAAPIFLVFVQPDFGTAMVYAAALAGVLFLGGTRWVHLAALGVGALVAALLVLWILPAAGQPVLKSYQQKPLTSLTHPYSDPKQAPYKLRPDIQPLRACRQQTVAAKQ